MNGDGRCTIEDYNLGRTAVCESSASALGAKVAQTYKYFGEVTDGTLERRLGELQAELPDSMCEACSLNGLRKLLKAQLTPIE